MSRIRSIHPGLWTDEAFVCLSPMARLLFMGIWNECDDMGSFEWSPLKLKMRILPADAVDAASLLSEIELSQGIIRYEVDGKSYGAVRNFCQYQRPKKPNEVYPQTDQVREWVNIAARSKRDGSEEVGNQLPTGGENPRQMEDGGGNKETDLAKAKPVKARKSARTAEFEIPEWVPAEPWAAYVAMRGRKRAKVDSYIADRLFAKLGKMLAAGWDIAKVLDKATLNNWTDVYAPTPGRDDDMRASATISPMPTTPEGRAQSMERTAKIYDMQGRTDEAEELRREAERLRQAA